MGAWTKELSKHDAGLASRLSQSREVGHMIVEELDLPHYKRVVLSVKDFLSEPEKVFEQLGTSKYFVFLQSQSGKRDRRLGLTKDEAISFVGETVGASEEEWELNIAEFLKAKFGGNVYVNKEGVATVEFKKGEQGPLSAGTVVPEYRAQQDRFTGVWKYSFDDVSLRKQVQQMMKEVPHEGREYMVGMYEFQWVSDEDDDILETKFVDYRKDE